MEGQTVEPTDKLSHCPASPSLASSSLDLPASKQGGLGEMKSLGGNRTHTSPCIQVFQKWWPDLQGHPAPEGTILPWHSGLLNEEQTMPGANWPRALFCRGYS